MPVLQSAFSSEYCGVDGKGKNRGKLRDRTQPIGL